MTRAALALAACALAAAALAQDLPPEVARGLAPYDEFRTHALASWHPLRREMLVRRRAGLAEMVHAVADPGTPPQAFDATTGATEAAWQPAHARLFVFTAEGADGMLRLHRYDVATQATTAVSPAGERVTSFAWNPAGDRIAYATAARDARGPRTTLRLVDPARPASERLLARVEGAWSELGFSPNGRRLAATQVVSAHESHLWSVDVATATRRRVTRSDPKATTAYRSARFSPDGNSLFALSDRGSDHRRLVLVPLRRGPERVLTAHHKLDVEAFALSADAGLLAFLTQENGTHVMRFIDLVTLKEQPRPALLDGVIGGLAWRPGSREIGFHIASARSAGDAFSYDAKTHQLTRWTNGNSPAVNTRELPEPRVVRWKSFDGREITGLHYHPPARFTGKRPVIVDHRAGPGAQARAGFLGRANYLVAEMGIAIIRPNVRGSAGFGRAFGALGRDDARKDIAALLEWVGTQPHLDAARVVVIGEGTSSEMDDEGFMRAAVDFARRAGP